MSLINFTTARVFQVEKSFFHSSQIFIAQIKSESWNESTTTVSLERNASDSNKVYCIALKCSVLLLTYKMSTITSGS